MIIANNDDFHRNEYSVKPSQKQIAVEILVVVTSLGRKVSG